MCFDLCDDTLAVSLVSGLPMHFLMFTGAVVQTLALSTFLRPCVTTDDAHTGWADDLISWRATMVTVARLATMRMTVTTVPMVLLGRVDSLRWAVVPITRFASMRMAMTTMSMVFNYWFWGTVAVAVAVARLATMRVAVTTVTMLLGRLDWLRGAMSVVGLPAM